MNRNQVQADRMVDTEAALAAEIFDHFSSATTMRQILGLYRSMCDTIGLRPGPINEFYPKLKSKIKSWKAQALWKKFDARAAHRVYNKGTTSNGTRVLVIGAGPCGLRTAIEAQLLGAKVVLVEKRDRLSRNNVLHLWPFLITDLRNLGAKKFYGKFCAGAIDHISIRQLQCILLKVALLLGVEVHVGISFINTIEPKDGCGWRAQISPQDHAVSHYEFDVLIGADGKRNTLEGFRRKEFRGRLAIAITANFINKKTWAEAKVEEISGVAFIFNQSFFKELYQNTGIDLENIVYYKDETHYFVMTAKKHSLIDKGVIIQDYADPAELLASANVNTERLLDYAKEAAQFSTEYQMTNLEFAVNHYGKPDVAMFDFTSMFAAEISCRVTVRKNYRLLQCLVGDSLLEPFWPTGSGCARGFLSSMDAAYAIKLWSNQRNSILAVLAQRESIYRLLAQTTPENLHRDIGSYTVDPATRYPNLNKSTVTVHQVKHLLDTDDPALLEQIFVDSNALHAAPEPSVRRKRRTADTVPLSAVLLRWIKAQLSAFDFMKNIQEASECFTNGEILCCLINRYRPELVDLSILKDLTVRECNELAFAIIERELGISPVMSPGESVTLENIDSKIWLNYLEQICEVFRGEIPHVKHPKLDLEKLRENKTNEAPDFSRLLKFSSAARKSKSPTKELERSGLDAERPRRMRKLESSALKAASGTPDIPQRRARKRRSHDKFGNVDERVKRLQEIEANRTDRQNKRRMHRAKQTENFYKSLHMLQANNLLRESDSSSPFEDYSIFMYRQSAPQFNDRVKDLEKKLLHPDRERGIPSALPRNGPDEQFNDRIKSMEQRITAKGSTSADKKPKDLLRAIGKIESNDWNIREIEKKIEQSKKTEVGKSREKVPKWSKEQFLQRQNKMSRPPEEQECTEERFKEIDQTIKNLDKQLKEGSVLELGERGKNKVASIAGNFVKKDSGTSEEKAVTKSGSKVNLVFNTQGASDVCHFCKQKVYLMEKLSAEGLVLHRGCLKCHHCHTSLRVGGYAFDRDDPEGKFYCTQHFRLPAKTIRPVTKRTSSRYKSNANAEAVEKTIINKTPEKVRNRPEGIAQLDLLDRGQTPERIEFENADAMSDGEPSLEHIIDENEWTDRNFGTGTEESDTDFTSSEESDSDSDSDMYEEAMGSPLGAQTLQLATDWIGKQRYTSNQYSDDDEFYASSEDDEADSQTEGEELEKARAIRMQEVKLRPLPYLPTDTETEVQTDSDSSSAIELNSATEISTDSEFERDPVVREIPQAQIEENRKPTRVQVKQGMIANGVRRTSPHTKLIPLQQSKTDIHLEFKPLVQVDPSVLSSNRMPLQNPRVGDYLLKQTASTEGIASKKSLELKKRYLLGENALATGIMKSDSTSVLDSKFKNFHSNISGCQKMLNPAPDISPAMQTFLKNTMISDYTSKPIANETAAFDISKIKNEELVKSSEEKENVYEHIVNTKNELNKSDPTEMSKPAKIHEHIEVLVENKIKENPSKVIETIDLVTPEKAAARTSTFTNDNCHIELSDHKIKIKQTGQSIDEVIDLTNEATVEISKGVDLHITSPSDKKEPISPGKSKPSIDSMLKTTKEIPSIAWVQNKEIESDSFTSSTTSSPADIPHHILESTTSPDTQATPVECCDKSNELMQMDSLMIIDGKYIGDPEDLKHMKLPDIIKDNKTIVPIDPVVIVKDEKKLSNTRKGVEPIYKYESIYKRPELKFDTKNENKIDSLKNLPLILPKEAEQTAKPSKPSLLNLIDTKKSNDLSDNDKTPTAAIIGNLITQNTAANVSDSETETTGHAFTETELSDWTADDAVSENFVDIEFVLNSNKGTIKRNKKSKKSHDKSINGSSKKTYETQLKQCPIAKELDFDGIEFMDTGSEESCMETYAATNKAMLRNRGYVQFVDTNIGRNHGANYTYTNVSERPTDADLNEETIAKPKEIRGIDFIEQGACILSNDIDLKTPINEIPPIFTGLKPRYDSQDSHNDIEEDSLVMIASHGGNTTTEESEALTVVTSPLESVPKHIDSYKIETPKKQKLPAGDESNSSRKDSDEITYEDYVRQLQMKITQISNARDSIDIRKTRRKHSKGELSSSELQCSLSPQHSQHSPTAQQQPQSLHSVIEKPNSSKSLSIYVGKSDEPTTVIEKLEVITKERTKQKDLIHDLVMDKLQSKKQLNAEKRLNRSRNRSSAFGNSPTTSNSPPAPPTNQQISHSQTIASINPKCHSIQQTPDLLSSMKLIEQERRHSVHKSQKVLIGDNIEYFTQFNKNNQRPLSENVEGYAIETPKLNKTQSFCVHGNRSQSNNTAHVYQSQFSDNINAFSTPVLPPRRKPDDELTQTTEKLRQDARHRARLKSNQDLGLSPEDKIELLRKRYHLDSSSNTSQLSAAPSKSTAHNSPLSDTIQNKSDDMKVRERKMMASKSVNDIAASNLVSNCGNGSKSDFNSDPNLLEAKTSPKRRSKDPERRKSIIQAVSDFFHKKKEKEPSSPKEKTDRMFGRFRISPKSKSKDKETISYERSKSEDCLKAKQSNSYNSEDPSEEITPPPIPPLPTNYQRSDDESYSVTENREQKKIRAINRASRQAELKRLRIAQEIQREQEEIEVKLKDLEARGVLIEKELRGEGQNLEDLDPSVSVGAKDEKLLKELLEIWRNITHLKKRDDELSICQKELKLEHRHAQLKEELNVRLSFSKLNKSSSDVAAEGAILNEMLDIVAKRAALRTNDSAQGTGLESDVL